MNQVFELWEKMDTSHVFYTVWEENGEDAPPTPLVYNEEDVQQADYVEEETQKESAMVIFDSESSAREHAKSILKSTNVDKAVLIFGPIQEMAKLAHMTVQKYKDATNKNMRVDVISVKGNEIYQETIMSNVVLKH